MDYKKRVREAVEGFIKKQDLPETTTRKNEKPENIVVNSILLWCKQNGFDVHVFESKAKFNVSTGRYTGRAASPGTPDIIGNSKNGLACYIEAKAPGCRNGSNLRPQQREFLTRKIQTECFAVCADSAAYVENTWNHFISLPPQERIEYLLKELPQHNPRQLKLDF